MNKNKNIKIAFILNIIIAILTLIASIIMFTGFKFMHGIEPVLESTKIGMLRFFTVESNIFMGIIALLFVLKKELTKTDYILKLMSTSAVTLTFIVVFTYLGFVTKGGIVSLLQNSNLFFHLIIPVLSIINFIFFENTDKLKSLKNSFYGIVPAFIYSIFYISNIIFHMENGKVSPVYDWYWFVQNGVWTSVIVVPIIFTLTYIISLVLWKLNKKKC